LLDPASSEIIGLTVSNSCDYFSSLAFPERIDVGLAVEAIATSSVRDRVGAYKDGAPLASAQGVRPYLCAARRSAANPNSRRPSPLYGKPHGHEVSGLIGADF
jgi:acyl-CoA thioester hydrolase